VSTPSAADSDAWEVTTASHTNTASYYLVIQESSKLAIKVIIAGKKRRYSWNDARKKEAVPDEVRREIDRALIRYLTK
jgi:hypothetical protein